jgi:hypothetical protein
MTKGASPAVVTDLGITDPTPTGRVIGKLAGWWQERGHPDNRDTSRV